MHTTEQLQLELLAIGVCQQHVSLCGGEVLQLLGAHHVTPQIGQLGLDLPLTFHGFSILLQVKFERLHIIIKPQGGHGEENVLAIDCLPLLSLASLTSLTKVKIILKGVFQWDTKHTW